MVLQMRELLEQAARAAGVPQVAEASGRSYMVKARCSECGHRFRARIGKDVKKDSDGNPVVQCPGCDQEAAIDVLEAAASIGARALRSDLGGHVTEGEKSALIKSADELKVGDVVFSILAHQWVKIIKVSQKSVSYVGSVKPDTLPQKHVFGSFNNLFWDNKGHPSENTKEDAVRLRESADGSVADLLHELGGQTFGRGRSRGRDPYWMTAKYAGKDAKGTPFRKGERVFYYPNDRSILAGKNAEQAAAEFQAAADDERTYNFGAEGY